MKKVFGALFLAVLSSSIVCAVELDWDKVKDSIIPHKDRATIEAEYLKRVEKDRIKEEYGRKIIDRTPSGYMTVEEYEALSQPKDKAVIDYGLPQVNKPYDAEYVPKPIYKLARYNDPPGSPDLTIPQEIFKTGQLNLQGITAPDFSIMVYPAVYYYPVRAAISCDLFMIALRDNDSSVNKILKANIANRYPEPILSTDKDFTNSSVYRTLTPIDFSADSKKLLIKQKIGSSADGIWETDIIVYDFSRRTSYNLEEVRAAISYYWKEYKGINLEDKRWDVYPLGFSKGNPDRVLLSAYAYTGETPLFLGVWSIDFQGEQSRLISLNNGGVEVAANGFKVVRDGVVSRTLVEQQEKKERDYVKNQAKNAKNLDQAQVREMKSEMKEKLKEVDRQFKLEREDYKLRNKLNGTTTENENSEIYEDLQKTLNEKRRLQAEKEETKRQLKEQKQQIKEQNQKLKDIERQERLKEKYYQYENTPPKNGIPLQNNH